MSAPTPRWCDGLPSVTATVWCSERTHRISWRRGKLVLEDHHLTAEQAMVALGGSVSECVRVLRRWQQRTGWDVPQMGFRAPRASPIPPELVAMRELTSVRAWERAWRRQAWSRDGELLARKLRKHALAPLLDSVRTAADRFAPGIATIADLEVQLADDDRAAMLGWMDAGGATATALLPPSWLYRVWARQLAFVDGYMIVDVAGDPADSVSITVSAVRWVEAFDGARTPAIERAALNPTVDGGWSLQWHAAS